MRNLRRLFAWIALILLILSIVALPLGVWVDWRWFPTSFLAALGCLVAYHTADRLDKMMKEKPNGDGN